MARHRGPRLQRIWKPRIQHDYDEPTPSQSVEMMQDIDNLPPGLRFLVYEYGAVLTNAVLESNENWNPKEIRFQLRQLRERRQRELLDIVVWTPFVAARFLEAFARGLTRMGKRRRRRVQERRQQMDGRNAPI